jgi:large subunit ribosomal protein L13
VDASNRVLGKLAQRIATVLMGKHKPIFDKGGEYMKRRLVPFLYA